MAAAAVVMAMPATAAAPALRSDLALERGILVEINSLRRSHGLAPVSASPGLAEAAEGHSRAMARHGFFSHSSRDGTVFWKRIARDYPTAGYRTWEVGENLVWSTKLDPKRAVRLWLDSPPHRKVLLNSHWRELGIAAISVTNAPGEFAGRSVTIVTADFGLRR